MGESEVEGWGGEGVRGVESERGEIWMQGGSVGGFKRGEGGVLGIEG